MKWKFLVLVVVILIGHISARPAEENVEISSTSPSITTSKVKETLSTLPATKSISQTPISTTTSTFKPTTSQVAEKITVAASNRYLLQRYNTTNRDRSTKFANNYSQLITKHNNHIHRLTLHDLVKTNIKPFPIPPPSIISSSSEYNSSSKPLTFNTDLTVPPSPSSRTTNSYVAKSTPKPSKEQLKIEQRKNLVTINNWSNYELDPIVYEPIQKSNKPVIHKVITKWTDDPSDAINYHYPYNDTTDYKINKLSEIFGDSSPSLATYFDQLPAILSQQLIRQPTLPPQPTQVVYSSPISDSGTQITTYVGLSNKLEIPTVKPKPKQPARIRPKPFDENDPNPPYATKYPLDSERYPYTTIIYEPVKKQNGCGNVNDKNYKENCNDVDIQIMGNVNDEVENISYDDKLDIPHDVETRPQPAAQNDFATGIDENFLPGGGPSPAIFTTLSQFLPNTGGNNNKKNKFGGKKKRKHKKKKGKHGMSISKIFATVMTILTIFNPLNFGVVGLMMAPMAAIGIGGMSWALYKFMANQKISYSGHDSPSTVVIRNRVKHHPIPIHITHHYDHQEPIPVVKTRRPHSHVYHSDPSWNKSHENSPDYYIDWQPSNGDAHNRNKARKHKFKFL